jgi:hypothetical protein
MVGCKTAITRLLLGLWCIQCAIAQSTCCCSVGGCSGCTGCISTTGNSFTSGNNGVRRLDPPSLVRPSELCTASSCSFASLGISRAHTLDRVSHLCSSAAECAPIATPAAEALKTTINTSRVLLHRHLLTSPQGHHRFPSHHRHHRPRHRHHRTRNHRHRHRRHRVLLCVCARIRATGSSGRPWSAMACARTVAQVLSGSTRPRIAIWGPTVPIAGRARLGARSGPARAPRHPPTPAVQKHAYTRATACVTMAGQVPNSVIALSVPIAPTAAHVNVARVTLARRHRR